MRPTLQAVPWNENYGSVGLNRPKGPICRDRVIQRVWFKWKVSGCRGETRVPNPLAIKENKIAIERGIFQIVCTDSGI